MPYAKTECENAEETFEDIEREDFRANTLGIKLPGLYWYKQTQPRHDTKPFCTARSHY